MKKFLTLFVFLGLFTLIACDDDTEDSIVPASGYALSVSLNATAFLPNDVVTATVTDISDDSSGRGDITLHFSILDMVAGKYDNSMFSDFPETAVLSSSSKSVSVDFVVGPVIEDNYALRLVTEAEGCTVSGANQNISIGRSYTVSLSVADTEDNKVREGNKFTILATTDPAPDSDLTITLEFEDGADEYISPLPTTFVIPAGSTTGETESLLMSSDNGDYQSEIYITVGGSTSDTRYAVSDPLTIVRIDKDTTYGDYLNDERWVYADPDAAFYSPDLESLYLNCPSYKEGDMLMKKYNFDTGEDGSPHPTASLAAEGWTLLNAAEFHAIDGAGYPRSALNQYGLHSIEDRNGWGCQNTTAVEKSIYLSNTKYTNVDDDGILRMWACVDEGYSAAGTLMHVGGSGLYAQKTLANVWSPQNTAVGEGTRIEIRARLRGDREGFLFALWMQGNRQSDVTWPEYGEIDILENHVNIGNSADQRNYSEQTIHWGYVDNGSNPTHNNPTIVNVMDDIEEWNIYWVEIVDSTTVKLGVNGETTRTFTKETTTNNHNDYVWPFCNSYNSTGFHLIINMYAGWNYSNQSYASAWGTTAFQNMTYEESKTSDTAPRMEIDWVRYWKNDNYDYDSLKDFGIFSNDIMYMY